MTTITLEGKECQNIGLPVLGFYGEWDSEPIIDKTLYDEEKSVINKYLTYEKSNFLYSSRFVVALHLIVNNSCNGDNS